MNKLSKRLLTIASLVEGKIIADVGCDHGKLSEYLLEKNIVKKVYVSDISKDSLEKAIKLLSSKNYEFESICTDGLNDYTGINDIDECVIAGMGGVEIINIIKSSPININSFILSPQHNIIETKEFMISKGYDIVYDIIIKDKNKFYTVFKCVKNDSKKEYSTYQLMFGRENFVSEFSDIREYIDYEIKKLNEIKKNVSNVDVEEKCKLFNMAKKELENNE